nr:hypothetical protein [Arsenophonus endosymbiont of Aphis craccivora]
MDYFWQMLISLPAEQVQKLAVRADENVLQGWIDLLDLYHNNYQDPAALQNAFKLTGKYAIQPIRVLKLPQQHSYKSFINLQSVATLKLVYSCL